MTYLKDFREKIAKIDYHNFLILWEEFCYTEELDPDELIQILKEAKNSEIAPLFGQHVVRALSLVKDIQDPEKAHEVIRLIFDIQTTNHEDLADFAYEYLKNRYKEDPFFDEKIRLIGLRTRENFARAISNYELLSHIGKGKFVYHTAGWGTGEILDYSLVREELTLEFDLVVGKRHLSFANALKTLIPLPDDHFLARRFGNPDALEKEAKENPLAIITLLLKDLGPKTSQEIKEELLELVIPQEDWNRFWQVAKTQMKKDTHIFVPKSTSEPILLLQEELPHEKLLEERLQKTASVDEMIQMVYAYFRDFSATLRNPEFKENLKNKILSLLDYEQISLAQKMQICFFLQDLGEKQGKELLEKILKSTQDFATLLAEIDIIALKKRALIAIRKNRSDWVDIFFSQFFLETANLIRDYLLQELITLKNDNRLIESFEGLLQNPISHPFLFFWYFQKLFSTKKTIPFSDEEGKLRFFESFLILLSDLDNKGEYKELIKKMANRITAGRYQLVRQVFQVAPIEQVKEFLLLFSKCSCFSIQENKILQSLAEVAHRSLTSSSSEKTEERGREKNILWTTKEGYQKTHARMEEIATVETIENAKEIEEARAHGDLRENAEYKAALEKRDRLQGELKFLSDQIHKARILTKEDVSTDSVNVGTIFTCSVPDEKEVTFTLLGPWDADVENNILAYTSKMGQKMIGCKVGDTFSMEGKQYKVESIKNYFA